MMFHMIVQLWNTNTSAFVSCDADLTENYMYISMKFGTGVHVFCWEVGVFNRSSFQSVSYKPTRKIPDIRYWTNRQKMHKSCLCFQHAKHDQTFYLTWLSVWSCFAYESILDTSTIFIILTFSTLANLQLLFNRSFDSLFLFHPMLYNKWQKFLIFFVRNMIRVFFFLSL